MLSLQVSSSIPVLRNQPDKLRQGPRSLRHEALAPHPVQALQTKAVQNEWGQRLQHAEQVYGRGVAMGMEMDRAVLSQFHRLPGIASEYAGLEAELGRDMELDFGDMFQGMWHMITLSAWLHRLSDLPACDCCACPLRRFPPYSP